MNRIPYESCPLCEAPVGSAFVKANCSQHHLYQAPLPADMTWLKCGGCGHLYTDGYFDDEAFKLLLSTIQKQQTPGFEADQRRHVWAPTVEAAQGFSSGGGRWLDVGFGDGSLLTTADEFGYDVVGLDLRVPNVEKLDQAGIKVHAVDLEGYRDDSPFQVISMMDVLEHMPFPKKALVRANQLLPVGGLLILSMPNADAFLWRIRGIADNPYWGEIEHYHNFGRKHLYALLVEHGFQPVRYRVGTRYALTMEVFATKIR